MSFKETREKMISLKLELDTLSETVFNTYCVALFSVRFGCDVPEDENIIIERKLDNNHEGQEEFYVSAESKNYIGDFMRAFREKNPTAHIEFYWVRTYDI